MTSLESAEWQHKHAAPRPPALATDPHSQGFDDVALPPLVLDTRLSLQIRRLTASRRRGDFIEALTTFAPELTRVPLSIACDVDTAQAFRDASREEIMLNGVCFVGDHRTEAFVAAIKRIVSRHVDEPDSYLAVTDRVMRGCSRTLSGSDSYFALHELFASPDMLVRRVPSSSVGTSVGGVIVT